jgi:2-polyprenyl-3-methyl-5-hydroxy-6-metoxy-1,4-benzoquinol methylase
LTDDVYSWGFQQWETRFKQSSVDSQPLQGNIGPEVGIAADAIRGHYGEGTAHAVDIGAGDGRHTLYLAARGFEVLAVDAAPSGIELIRQRLKRNSLQAELIVADLRQYEIPASVDLLVASYIIHLLPNPYDYIETWQAKVRPGGVCSISTHGRFPHDPDELWFPADFDLKRLFEVAGWFVLHAREEDNWNAGMERHIRERAVDAVKPETS